MCHIRYLLVSGSVPGLLFMAEQMQSLIQDLSSLQHHINGKYPSIYIYCMCLRSFNLFCSLLLFIIELVLGVFWGVLGSVLNMFWMHSEGILWVMCLLDVHCHFTCSVKSF